MRTLLAASLLLASTAWAGPPFETDDPEPVGPGHVELYLSAVARRSGPSWEGSLPILEVNYGAAPDLQLHAAFSAGFGRENGAPLAWTPGNVELGAKIRLLHETTWLPQLGFFPLLELPTGDGLP